MLQPRIGVLFLIILVVVHFSQGHERSNISARKRRQDGQDVTTVLLVDSNGRSQFGRFLNVKPDLGVLTSTARTFIQEGVTTEYATQVLGTTLDNGRLYAHLLTKSSRVLYDHDVPTRLPNDPKNWVLANYGLNGNAVNFVKNTDYVSPNRPEPYVVFPTIKSDLYKYVDSSPQLELSDEELLQAPSNNPRIPYQEEKENNIFTVSSSSSSSSSKNNNVKTFKISPQLQKNIAIERLNTVNDSSENDILHKDETFGPSKVKEWTNLPTFTVRNEFSPSGYSFLGDLPDLRTSTERSKHISGADRKAKLLFRAGLAPKPDLKTVTYTGFADFTTTVGDTVIIFSPQTEEVKKSTGGHVTKISVEATLSPQATLKEPTITTKFKTYLLHDPGMETQTVEGHKLNMHTMLPTMVIDASNRQAKSNILDKSEDIEAKSKVLAHEQKIPTPSLSSFVSSTKGSTIIFSPDVIEPSESEMPMLSTPSDEDIAKIFASLQAQAVQVTEPLNTPATIFFDEETNSFATDEVSKEKGGATTIFFDEETAITNTAITEQPTTSKVPEITTENILTTTEQETTTNTIDTTENVPSTTSKEETTTNELLTTSENGLSFTTPEESTNEIDTETDVTCTNGHQILPTTVFKTLTYLTTFYIPIDESTSTSVKSNKVVSTEIGFETVSCEISPSAVHDNVVESTISTTTEQQTESYDEETTTDFTTTEEITTQVATTETVDESTEQTTQLQEEDATVADTTTMEITTERRHVTESEPETTEMTTENGEEIELVFKTLYTTYTYLTTYFQESTSSVASRKEVITNVITSTIDPSKSTDDPISGLNNQENFKSKPVTFDDIGVISPSKVGIDRPTSIDTLDDDNDEENELNAIDVSRPTPALSDDQIKNTVNGVKTYYTTYTYFTTIFVDGETEISSRTEVYTNFVTITPSAVISNIEKTELPDNNDLTNGDEDDIDEEDDLKSKLVQRNMAPLNSYNSTIKRDKPTKVVDSVDNTSKISQNNINYSTLHRSTTESNENELLDLSEYETISTMVTDVRSSTSEGDRRILDNVDKRNVLLDDQIVSESNNDSEILPSPTLLLQTSYTTFTYFTTMYQGTSSSNVVSRLETITNVVTETLSATHSLSVEDLNLPITYFTTFTYWTTLYKDGTTKVTSREETISNIITPSSVLTTTPPTVVISPSAMIKEISPSIMEEVTSSLPEEVTTEEIEPTTLSDIEEDLTTYFTTYTYYTTSYVGNSTVLSSRLETVTNTINKTDIETNQIGRTIGSSSKNTIDEDDDVIKTTPITEEEENEEGGGDGDKSHATGLLSTIVSTVENDGVTTVMSTDVYGTYIDGLYAKVLESTAVIQTNNPDIEPSSSSEQKLKPTGIVSINKGKIVDAEGISTLYYTTKAVGTYIDNLYAQVIESTSSLHVDEEKKSSISLESTVSSTTHKTGLVRFIEGSIEQNHTTTLYQSKVLGTIIDGRYAQIIESTSSFIVDTIQPSKASDSTNIAPTPTVAPDSEISGTKIPITPSPVVIEGSISDATKGDEENTTEDDIEGEDEEEEGEDEDGNSRVKSRLTFQSRKRTFTPVIRPFASRPRPSFAPKRKGSGVGSATTITRSDFTPTVTAIPASKAGSRFGGRRGSSSGSISPSSASGSRRFQRTKSSSQSQPNSSFAPSRQRGSSSRIQPTGTGFGSSSRRNGGFRSSSAVTSPNSIRPSSSFAANNRFRLRPSINRALNGNSVTPPSTASDLENDLTTLITDNPTDLPDDEQETVPPTTTEVSRRNQNPLLRFRRPPLSRPTPAARTTTSKPNQITTRNGNGNRNNNRTPVSSATTVAPRTTSRVGLQSRARPGNSLFPRRNLFTTTTAAPVIEEYDEDIENEEGDDGDTDYEGSDQNSQTEKAPEAIAQTNKPTQSRSYNSVQIKPFAGFRRRTKRQTNYSRFRRPTGRTTTSAPTEEPETEAPKPSRTSKNSRFSPRGRNRNDQVTQSPRITPSRSSSNQGRSQFTLRDAGGSTRSNFRRPTTQSSSRRYNTTPRTRPRLPTENNYNSRKTTSRPRSTRRRTTASRAGNSAEVESNFLLPGYDGTITVTHQIPTEVTIPVVNGKITEYKNIVTAKLSTEILGPKQYTTSISPYGKQITLLLIQSSSFGGSGEKLLTKYILNETPTTSVIFTPTYIRGRKTSYSHVIPSTAYVVEPVVNTIAPNLANQAPLANILLSQLLLGNAIQQNPLINGVQNPGTPATPVTEFQTRTTTYVTTVTSETSTIIPITFRGKEILTTIIDSNVNVITATEFLTDTIVVTPTPTLQQNNQLNSLLVPLLLQQQQAAQQQQQQQYLNPLFQQPAGVTSVDQFFNQGLFQEQIKQNLADDDSYSDEDEVEQQVDVTEKPKRNSSRKKNRKPAIVEPIQETSIITLYVSGRTPGEFSTVLSTVVIGEDTKKKREATYIPVEPSKVIDDLLISTLEYVDSYIMPAMKDVEYGTTAPTESLESIIGDVSKKIVTDTPEIKPSKLSTIKKYQSHNEKSSGAVKQSPGNFLAL